MSLEMVYIMVVVFVATLIRSTFGFGEAMIAVPLLSLVVSIELATPVVALLSILIAATVLIQDWKHLHFRSAMGLLLPTLAGIPLGIMFLTSPHRFVIKAVLGALIAAFSLFVLITEAPEIRGDSRPWMLVCGFLAGVCGGAYGMNGPPLVIYGSMRRWTMQQMRV